MQEIKYFVPDELDIRILKVIKENARLTYSEIAEQVGVSRVSVKNRMDILEEKNIIKGYHTIIDMKGAPEGTRFLLDITTDRKYFEDVLEFLARDKAIREIYIISGKDMIHAEGYTVNPFNVKTIVDRLYRGCDKISSIDFSVVLSTVKSVDGGVDYVRYKEPEYMEDGKPDSVANCGQQNEDNHQE